MRAQQPINPNKTEKEIFELYMKNIQPTAIAMRIGISKKYVWDYTNMLKRLAIYPDSRYELESGIKLLYYPKVAQCEQANQSGLGMPRKVIKKYRQRISRMVEYYTENLRKDVYEFAEKVGLDCDSNGEKLHPCLYYCESFFRLLFNHYANYHIFVLQIRGLLQPCELTVSIADKETGENVYLSGGPEIQQQVTEKEEEKVTDFDDFDGFNTAE
ncbi:Hypothetical_protein [Hexamita inflata]|uniref:Hypothetical_protein n=1 Tax=Hexamita inflata TaxID=28002 RepID=A0AA86R4F4_9EUKA|nr:Hypothetical protein HINF_LOCUS54506 [Hexamita inflata]